MSLKDLLPPGTYDEICCEAHQGQVTETDSEALMVSCPYCHKRIVYSSANPFRPFCSERCKMLDLGAWANEERTVAGNDVNMDADGDLLSDPNLPVRNVPGQDS